MNDQNKAELRRLILSVRDAGQAGDANAYSHASGLLEEFLGELSMRDIALSLLDEIKDQKLQVDVARSVCRDEIAGRDRVTSERDLLIIERDDLRAEVEALRKDSDRLNWLDGQYQNVVEGSGSNAELVAHKWVVEWPASTVREAIDAIAKEGGANG